MRARQLTVQYRREPLRFIDKEISIADAFRLPQGELCLAEASAARAVLANADELYEEHSDFFHTRRGVFGPRPVQVRIGRPAKALLGAYLRAHASELPAAVQRNLAPSSEWPDAGNWLVYRHLAPALVAPESPARLLRTVEEIVERAVLAGARERQSRLRRAVFRHRVMRELARAVEQRRARAGNPADVLDVVVGAVEPGVPPAEIGEVFLSFLFAVAGSVGFVLGWSLYLLGTHPRTDAKPAWVVREALRLWPVAWMLSRRPARPHAMAGVEVTPQDEVIVCPYAVHRNPRHWDDPDLFRPARWGKSPADPEAFIPFGCGPHQCIAGTLSMQLVEDILRILDEGYRLAVTSRDTRPCIGPALAPPRFTLHLEPYGPGLSEKSERR